MCLGICGDLLLRSVNSIVAALTKTSHQLPGLASYCSSQGDPSAQSLRGFRQQCRQVWKHHLSFIHSPWQVIWEGHLVDPTSANLSMSPRWEGDAHRFWILPFTSSEVREHRCFPLYSSKFLHFLELPLRGKNQREAFSEAPLSSLLAYLASSGCLTSLNPRPQAGGVWRASALGLAFQYLCIFLVNAKWIWAC